MNEGTGFGVFFVWYSSSTAPREQQFCIPLTAPLQGRGLPQKERRPRGLVSMSLLLLAHHSWGPPGDSPLPPGHKLHPGLADGRAMVLAAGCCLSPSEPPSSSRARARLPGVVRTDGNERLRSIPAPPLPRRRTTPRAFPLQLRLSFPRCHGRAPGHAAGRAGAGLRAAARAGATAGGRPLPGAGRGREERPLPGPVRGAESHRALRAGEEGPSQAPEAVGGRG